MEREEAERILLRAWPAIVEECRSVLGGELHYQAVVYHCLRNAGCPNTQIGMNVKQEIKAPVTPEFIRRNMAKKQAYQGYFEPIPDIVLFKPDINGNWQRRNYENTLRHMVCAIEVKASERERSRLGTREIRGDIAKLAAHRDELVHRGGTFLPVMMVIDVAPGETERMRADAVAECAQYAAAEGVVWLYVSPTEEACSLNANEIIPS